MAIAPFCEVIPQADHQVSFQMGGREVTRWHYGPQYPRPFFYPLLGPAGVGLTRMGHPGAPNHDHHRSVWFAHYKLMGIDFWGDNTDARIRQTQWFVYEDGDEQASMAVELGWFDGHDPAPLVRQELIVTLRPLGNEYTLDFQSRFVPTAAEIEFQQTHYGFFAVRVAKSLSTFFGGGTITGASGATGEPDLFGQPNPWMDYSGPVATEKHEGTRSVVTNGITYFDHPSNPFYPAKWHVRQDGWMGASGCRDEGLITTRTDPLLLRYLLHVHDGPVNAERANQIAADWAQLPELHVTKGSGHHQFQIVMR